MRWVMGLLVLLAFGRVAFADTPREKFLNAVQGKVAAAMGLRDHREVQGNVVRHGDPGSSAWSSRTPSLNGTIFAMCATPDQDNDRREPVTKRDRAAEHQRE